MNLDQARQVMLVRAVEQTQEADRRSNPTMTTPVWSQNDSTWATDQTLRGVGEHASAEQFLVQRSQHALERMAERDPGLGRLHQPGGPPVALTAAGLITWALLAGLASDAIGPSRQINVLAPPLLAVIAWNIAVYLVLLVSAARRRFATRAAARSSSQGIRAWLAAIWAKRLAQPQREASSAAGQFATDWAMACRPLHWQRVAMIAHLAAIAVAAGALTALYTRGLVFEYRAGWDSTFLGADFVHRWLNGVLAPAQALSGLPLPDAARIEALRFSNGEGENAARWIHWYAITTALVMLPRVALAAFAAGRTRRMQQNFPLALDDRYFQRLLQHRARAGGKAAQIVAVLPYGFQQAGELQTALDGAIDAQLGPGLASRILPNQANGSEDDLPDDWLLTALRAIDVGWVLPLLVMSATPERETHGAFLAKVKSGVATLRGNPAWRVMIDESGFRKRLTGADLPRRLAERRRAWQALLDEFGAGSALFVDLTPEKTPTADPGAAEPYTHRT